MSSKFGTKIKVEQIEIGCFPEKAYNDDAAYGLHVGTGVEIFPHQRFYVPLGFKIQLPSNMKLLIQPRSGMSGKGYDYSCMVPILDGWRIFRQGKRES